MRFFSVWLSAQTVNHLRARRASREVWRDGEINLLKENTRLARPASLARLV